jgi:hypothetical protein
MQRINLHLISKTGFSPLEAEGVCGAFAWLS